MPALERLEHFEIQKGVIDFDERHWTALHSLKFKSFLAQQRPAHQQQREITHWSRHRREKKNWSLWGLPGLASIQLTLEKCSRSVIWLQLSDFDFRQLPLKEKLLTKKYCWVSQVPNSEPRQLVERWSVQILSAVYLRRLLWAAVWTLGILQQRRHQRELLGQLSEPPISAQVWKWRDIHLLTWGWLLIWWTSLRDRKWPWHPSLGSQRQARRRQRKLTY